MTTEELTKRAMEIRAQYIALAKQKGARVWTTQDIAQGLVGDVGDLSKLVMAKSGLRDIENTDQRLKHELADCLWSLLVLAHEYDINLEEAFVDTMKELDARFAG